MIYVCICTNNLKERQYLITKINEQLEINMNFINYDYIHQIPIEEKHDVYIVKINTDEDYARAVDLRAACPKSAIIVLSDTEKYAIKSYMLDSKGYLLTPLEEEMVIDVIQRTHRAMKKRIMLIRAIDGTVRVNPEDLNYINIEGRRLCYHMSDGEKIYSQSLRESFIGTLRQSSIDERDYLFLHPAVVVNDKQIKKIDDEKVIFKNGENCYLSKMQLTLLNRYLELW